MHNQSYTVPSGDIHTITPNTVVDSAGLAIDISGYGKVKFRAYPKSGVTIDGETESLVKELPTTWAATTAYSLGDFVIPTTPDGFSYECTTAGTSDSSEPSFPAVLGNTVSDGTAEWTCRNLGIEFTDDGTDGEFDIVLGATDTDALSGEYFFEIRVVDDSDDEFVVATGVLNVIADKYTS